MTKKTIILIGILLLYLNCNSDDESGFFDPCEGRSQIPEVTISNVTLQPVDNGKDRGYFLRATITNNTNENLDGEPTFVFYNNGIPHIVSGPGICGYLDANSICKYDNYVFEEDGQIDFEAYLDCFYYTLD